MTSSGVLHLVALERTDIPEERIIFLRSVLRLLFTANVVPSSPILVTLMVVSIRSSETSVLKRATFCKIPYSILQTAKVISGREFRTRVNAEVSSQYTIQYGVPQGSVLGPMLYMFYTTDHKRVFALRQGTLLMERSFLPAMIIQ
jgi:hypothetical protein